ncbi:hypothetical protein HYZ78_01130 [Candidatus Microgenomates bacterium]|nr:hypothetical protein [Candidatus Microgenomates bacterium]
MNVETAPQRGPFHRVRQALEGFFYWGGTHPVEQPQTLSSFGDLPSLSYDIEVSEESVELLRADLLGLISRYGISIDHTRIMAMRANLYETTYATAEIDGKGNIGRDVVVYYPGLCITGDRPETAAILSEVLPDPSYTLIPIPYTRAQFDGGFERRHEWGGSGWVTEESDREFDETFRNLQSILRSSVFYSPTEEEARAFLEITQNPSKFAKTTTVEGRLQHLGLAYARV